MKIVVIIMLLVSICSCVTTSDIPTDYTNISYELNEVEQTILVVIGIGIATLYGYQFYSLSNQHILPEYKIK